MRHSFLHLGTQIGPLLLDPPESPLWILQPSPALWLPLARALPKAGCTPADGLFLYRIRQYSSRLNANPFVIQPFNFFQMFPNKQQNKIKRECFFFLPSTKANGPKLSQPVKQCQSRDVRGGGGGGQGARKRSWHFAILPIEIQCICLAAVKNTIHSGNELNYPHTQKNKCGLCLSCNFSLVLK